jgi:hypothetical protein
MAFRTFTDSAGTEWQAYDVVPQADERRHYDRRSSAEDVEGERRQDDRRVTVGRHSLLVNKQGWLAFESATERRRLSPIPENWERATNEELNGLLESATPVVPLKR